MSKSNALSQFGRMSYGAHLLLYPSLLGLYLFGYKPYSDNKNKKASEAEWVSKLNLQKHFHIYEHYLYCLRRY